MQQNGYINLFGVFKKYNYDFDLVFNFDKIKTLFCCEEHFYLNGFVDLCINDLIPTTNAEENPTLDDFKNHYKEFSKLIELSIPKFLSYLKDNIFLISDKKKTYTVNQFLNYVLEFKNINRFISVFGEYFNIEILDCIFNKLYIDYKESYLPLFKSLLDNKLFKAKFNLINNNNNNAQNSLDIYKICNNIFLIIEKDNVELFKLLFDDSQWCINNNNNINNNINNNNNNNKIQSDIFWFFVCLKDSTNITRYLLTEYAKEKKEKGQVNPLEIDPLYLLEITSMFFNYKVAKVVLEIYPPEKIVPEIENDVNLEGLEVSINKPTKSRVLDVNMLFKSTSENQIEKYFRLLNDHKITINPTFFQKYQTYSNQSIFKSLFYQKVNKYGEKVEEGKGKGPIINSEFLNKGIKSHTQNLIKEKLLEINNIKIHFRSIESKEINVCFIYDLDVMVVLVISFGLNFSCDCQEYKKHQTCIHPFIFLEYFNIPFDHPFFISSKKSFMDVFIFFRLYCGGSSGDLLNKSIFNHQLFNKHLYGSPFFSSFYQDEYTFENKTMEEFISCELFLNLSRLAYYYEENEEFQSVTYHGSFKDMFIHSKMEFDTWYYIFENLTLYRDLSRDFLNHQEIARALMEDDQLSKLMILFHFWGKDLPVMYKNKIPLALFTCPCLKSSYIYIFKVQKKNFLDFFKYKVKNTQDLKGAFDDPIIDLFLQKYKIPLFHKSSILSKIDFYSKTIFKNQISIYTIFFSISSFSTKDIYNILVVLNSCWGTNYPLPSSTNEVGENKNKKGQYSLINNSENLKDEETRKKIEMELLGQENKSKSKSKSKSKNNNNNNNISNVRNIIVIENNSNDTEEEKLKQDIQKKNVIKQETSIAIHSNINEQKETIVYDTQVGTLKFNTDENNLLGRGSNGTLVFKGVWRDKIPVAIKQMNKMFIKNISKEIEALIKLTDRDGSNVVRYIHQEEDKSNIYLGLTLCGKSVQDLINQNELQQFIGIDDDERLVARAMDIVSGIQFLHSNGIVHNDLNPRNILTKDGKFIISDLGLSKIEVESSFEYSMHAPTGQEGFHPLEVLMEKRKTKSVDIFSLGCILYYIATNGQHPFGEKLFRVVNIVSNKYNLNHLQVTQPVLCNLIKQMLSKDETSRPTIDQVSQHLFFWNTIGKIQFIDKLNNLFKDNNKFNSNLNKLLNNTDIEGGGFKPYLTRPWNQLIDKVLLDNISSKQQGSNSKRSIFYQYDQIKDLVRCIRNTIQHHKEIQKLIQSNDNNKVNNETIIKSLETQEDVLKYFELKFPDLLFFLYNKFKYSSEFRNLIVLN
ncbi:hypothetical protein DICPUDRAFT_80608 [Dictyostelium purpureum]|uniref:non-specific serine/threonine protein kinase n=1 Tax=Dictyostelium purpureum TaxID=5786 RepID=F0ZR00_DICPU|nr:uncharacterized protein DICPUDRAFT_80608 [Dictyostelium purpureum]EGC33620.1 hypothetical protein DICPUDRAFT_80608 [Dictyostelium purpureum]|eukprot:XP_003289840.1 hypothetical protein DICPUDRAFT_80608 [Dictyostelium purpureum]